MNASVVKSIATSSKLNFFHWQRDKDTITMVGLCTIDTSTFSNTEPEVTRSRGSCPNIWSLVLTVWCQSVLRKLMMWKQQQSDIMRVGRACNKRKCTDQILSLVMGCFPLTTTGCKVGGCTYFFYRTRFIPTLYLFSYHLSTNHAAYDLNYCM